MVIFRLLSLQEMPVGVHASIDESLQRLNDSSPGTQVNTPDTPLTVSPRNWGMEDFSGSEAEQESPLQQSQDYRCRSF